MIEPPIPADEDQRLEDLRRLDLELSEPEEALDAVTARLAHIFEVPATFISFIDRDTLYAKSVAGPFALAAPRTEPRELAICSHVVGNNDMVVVEDLLADERFCDNPLVVESGARFYAGTPLHAETGRAVGSLCIVDDKPRTISERERSLLRVLAEGVMAQVKLQHASRQLLRRTVQIEQDLAQAVQVQQFLLPPATLAGEGWCIRHVYRPVVHLGGDFLDLHERPDGRVAILVADVTGHGTSAALTAAMTKTAFGRAAADVDDAPQLLNAIHGELIDMVRPGQFMSAVAALFDPQQRRVQFASAGHPPPLMINNSHVETVDHTNETLLLVQPDEQYSRQTTLDLPQGHRMLIYTDGAVEAADAEGNMLGVAGLSQHARDAAQNGNGDWLKQLLVLLHRHGGGLQDDVALLSIESQ